jgi:hypothetical protein
VVQMYMLAQKGESRVFSMSYFPDILGIVKIIKPNTESKHDEKTILNLNGSIGM